MRFIFPLPKLWTSPTPESATAPYGRRAETDAIFRRFDAGRNLRMLGPRRLGKTLVLHRLEERAPAHGYTAIRIDVSHCRDERAFFARLCQAIEGKRERGTSLLDSARQRWRQFSRGGEEGPDSWWQSALKLDWETFAEHLIATIAEDQTTRWVLLIDETPGPSTCARTSPSLSGGGSSACSRTWPRARTEARPMPCCPPCKTRP